MRLGGSRIPDGSNGDALNESHQYLIEFKVMSVGKDGKAIVLSRPAILTKTGQEGHINVVEKTPDEVRVDCTALIKEMDTGVEAVTTVNVMEKGNEVFSTIQSITMQKR